MQLEPLLGNAATYCMGIGLMAAGLSSALTAPIAAAYAARGLFDWPNDDRDIKFRAVWVSILVFGVIVAMTGLKPILIIKFAQITNAILLPLIVIFLISICNNKSILGKYTNSWLSNVLGIALTLIAFSLTIKTFMSFF